MVTAFTMFADLPPMCQNLGYSRKIKNYHLKRASACDLFCTSIFYALDPVMMHDDRQRSRKILSQAKQRCFNKQHNKDIFDNMSEEPAAKKAKTGWEDHKCNASEALMKANEGMHFDEIIKSPVSVLQGIGPMHTEVSAALKITTVEELATYKFYLIAKSLKTMAGVETKDGRLSDSVMNVDEAVDKDAEAKTFTEMIESPIHILQGLTPEAEALFAKMDVKSVGDLADWKYAHWAEAMVELSKYEFTKTGTSKRVLSFFFVMIFSFL
jgi:vacuolar-type H+-ATPase subunit H